MNIKEYKDVLILTAFAIVAGTALSGVYGLTKVKIEGAAKGERISALKAVLPTLGLDAREIELQHEGLKIPAVLDGDRANFKGAVLELETRKGYAGKIRFMVGVDQARRVTGLYVLEQAETPGLGTKAKEESWWGQFKGKGQDNFKFKVKKDGGDADAITAATITSRAITDQVDIGLTALARHLDQQEGR